MVVLIIAGGSGTRLWPLSTPDFPKHLLKLNGDQNSLLQNTYLRAKTLSDDIFVVSEVGHIKHVKDQLLEIPDGNFIVEPGRRGTASCIALSLSYIKSLKGINEPVAIIAADHYIRDNEGFKYSFELAVKLAKKLDKIVLVGAEPTYPSTGFGYIKKGNLVDENLSVFSVDSFKEKPDYQTASRYLKSGDYLWNCGYFVGSIQTFEREMKKNAKELYDNYLTIKDGQSDKYLDFESISIDYALIEKVKDLLVIPATFDWVDLGTFNDLAKSTGSNELGNFVSGPVELSDTTNSYIVNNETKPVVTIGIDNLVVINSKDGILITRKDLSQKVGDLSKKLNK